MSERDDFEAAMFQEVRKTDGTDQVFRRLGNDEYAEAMVQMAWLGWRARGKLEAVPYVSNTPTLGEARVAKSRHGKDWKPRDLLAKILRDLDEGRIGPEDMIVVFRDKDAEGDMCTHYVRAGADSVLAIGLLATAQWMVINRD